MNFPLPQNGKITVFSKSGCLNCTKVKNLLKEKNLLFTVIDCDEFLLENKDEFLNFINNIIGSDYKMFPIVFDNEKFIGGYNETVKFIDSLLEFDLTF